MKRIGTLFGVGLFIATNKKEVVDACIKFFENQGRIVKKQEDLELKKEMANFKLRD